MQILYDIYMKCPGSCYTGNYEAYTNCPICDASRLDVRGKAKKVMPYLSVKDRLKIQFNDENRVKELLYRRAPIGSVQFRFSSNR